MKSEPAQPYITLLQLLSVLEYHKFIFLGVKMKTALVLIDFQQTFRDGS